MKKLLLASLVVAGTVVAANAQEVSKDSAAVATPPATEVAPSSAAVQDGYAEIKSEELPDAVKKSLEAPEFKGWIINAASYDKKEEKYAVELKNGADTKKVKFDKEGKALAE